MILADVGDDRGVRARHRQATAQDAAAVSTRGSRSTRLAPAGPDQSPHSRRSPSTNTPSVQLKPATWPASRAIAASRRTVVVLPLEPVTSAVRTGASACHSIAASPACASASVTPKRPAPKVSSSSSSYTGMSRRTASATSASSAGRASARASRCKVSRAESKSSVAGWPGACGSGKASCAQAAPCQAHSFNSVAANRRSRGAASASAALPPAPISATISPSCCQPSPARIACTRSRHCPSCSRVAAATSSTAPVPAKYRLWPVRRRELSK
jgi:hypothetical protein